MGHNESLRELEEELEALVIAIPKEEAAYQFYLNLANSTIRKGARKMFLLLAEQEIAHKNTLEKMVLDIQRELNSLKSQKNKT